MCCCGYGGLIWTCGKGHVMYALGRLALYIMCSHWVQSWVFCKSEDSYFQENIIKDKIGQRVSAHTQDSNIYVKCVDDTGHL